VIADAGSCSSRIVLNAQGESVGAEMELYVRPNEKWDLGLAATYADATITEDYLPGQPVAGVRKGNRLPTAPELQASATAAYNWNLTDSLHSYVRFTVQHVGSSYTQLADQEDGFGTILDPSLQQPNDGTASLIDLGDLSVNRIDFDAELKSYDIGNLRWGFGTDAWEAALFVNNLWDERAFLSIDRERGRRARVGYLTNQPRTFGVNFHMNF
jgi:iron complex outermembrane receptor protein